MRVDRRARAEEVLLRVERQRSGSQRRGRVRAIEHDRADARGVRVEEHAPVLAIGREQVEAVRPVVAERDRHELADGRGVRVELREARRIEPEIEDPHRVRGDDAGVLGDRRGREGGRQGEDETRVAQTNVHRIPLRSGWPDVASRGVPEIGGIVRSAVSSRRDSADCALVPPPGDDSCDRGLLRGFPQRSGLPSRRVRGPSPISRSRLGDAVRP